MPHSGFQAIALRSYTTASHAVTATAWCPVSIGFIERVAASAMSRCPAPKSINLPCLTTLSPVIYRWRYALQMRWVNAWRIVTAMINDVASRNRAYKQFPCDSMGWKCAATPTTSPDTSIAQFMVSTSPKPTSTGALRFIDFRPETICKRTYFVNINAFGHSSLYQEVMP